MDIYSYIYLLCICYMMIVYIYICVYMTRQIKPRDSNRKLTLNVLMGSAVLHNAKNEIIQYGWMEAEKSNMAA